MGYCQMKQRRPETGARRFFIAFLVLVACGNLIAYDYFADGLKLFKEGKSAEAAPMLHQASLLDGADPRVFIYLGLSYQQAGKFPDAISAFMRGASVPGTDRKALFYNAGNIYYLQKLYREAETMYTRSIEADTAYAPAYLNRANTRVNLQLFSAAVEDYNIYLTLDPASWQGESIRQLVALLSDEAKRQAEESMRAEAQRVATEAEKAAQEERFKKLMDEVSASLQSVDGASTLSAGSEDILEYDEEGQLE